MATRVNLRIVGHELVMTVKRAKKGTVEEHQRLKVKLRGVAGDSKTVMTLMCDPAMRDEFPLGENAQLAISVPQTQMDLGGDGKGARASSRAAH